MSNYNSTATATIYVNGQPAQQTIAKLKDDVLGYKKRLQEIAADKSLGVNSKQWNDVRKKMHPSSSTSSTAAARPPTSKSTTTKKGKQEVQEIQQTTNIQ